MFQECSIRAGTEVFEGGRPSQMLQKSKTWKYLCFKVHAVVNRFVLCTSQILFHDIKEKCNLSVELARPIWVQHTWMC